MLPGKIRIIDFTKLSEEDKTFLSEFLIRDEMLKLTREEKTNLSDQQKRNRVYQQKIFRQTSGYDFNGTYFMLSQSLARRTKLKDGKKSFRYTVYDNHSDKLVGKGGFGIVCPVSGKLKRDNQEIAYKPTTDQVIKIQKIRLDYYEKDVKNH